jgi:hypothetical protein
VVGPKHAQLDTGASLAAMRGNASVAMAPRRIGM